MGISSMFYRLMFSAANVGLKADFHRRTSARRVALFLKKSTAPAIDLQEHFRSHSGVTETARWNVVSSLHCMNDPQPEGHMASHIGRRKFLATLLGGGAAAWPMAARGQHTSVRHIGVLMYGVAHGETARFLLDPLRDGLRELGWIEGQNISLDYRFGHGQVDLLPALASQLVQRGVEVIVTEGTPASLAARNASPSVAIVVGASADPVRSGLVASLSRPGGNVTGLSLLGPELAGKRLQLLAQIVPRLARVGALFNPTNPVTSWELEETQSAAPSLNLAIDPRPVRGPDELEAAFVAMNAARPDAFVVMPDGMLYAARARVVRLAAAARLPGLFPEQEVAREGG